MEKKWYNYFVSVNDAGAATAAGPDTPSPEASNPAQTVADIASSVAVEPKFTTPVSDPTSFDQIYEAAEIPPAPKGYSIMKVADMMQSEHIRSMPADVRRS